MTKTFFKLLEASAAPSETTDPTTTSNILLDENGQFADVSQVADNVSTWWEELNLVETILSKLPTVIIAAVVIAAGYIIAKILAKIVVKTMSSKGVDPSVYNFIRRIIIASVNLIFILSAVSMFIDVNSIIVALGGAGVAAGLGLQASVSQFVSGIQLLVNRPFKTGDFVEINGISGNVVDVRFMDTVITTVDNKRIIIPNSHITTNHIINYSTESKRRVDFDFSISYSDDISHAKRIIAQVAAENQFVLKEPATEVYVKAHDSSCITLTARLWCKNEHYWDVFFAMQENVKLAFDKNGVCIPFNQLDVHIVEKK